MNNALDNNEIDFLLLVHRLHSTHRPLGRNTIVPYAELRLPNVAIDYDKLASTLQEKGLIQGDSESFSLTPDGESLASRFFQQYSLLARFYDKYYQAVLHSKAHALFCERVYGKNLCQHGAADMEQLHFLLSEIEIESQMSILDFGCGDGRISEYISDITQTFVSGVDIAGRAIELAQKRTQGKRERLHFYWYDVETGYGSFPSERFDRIIAIDSLFFVRDERVVLQVLLDYLKPDGRMGVFHHYHKDVSPEQTVLGKALEESGISYYTSDLSIQDAQHWQKKKRVLLELESLFFEEGNEFLFKNRMAECNGPEDSHRYLYVISV